uniref:Uncharacterized protein n=1 Tax=Angiostrongylus cantonensis TaxID=6313 RepID=A0A0K0D308_ANGCA
MLHNNLAIAEQENYAFILELICFKVSDGGNNGGIPIPKTSGDFPAELSIERNGHFYAILLDVLDDRGEVYVNHPDGGRATAVVDVEGLPPSIVILVRYKSLASQAFLNGSHCQLKKSPDVLGVESFAERTVLLQNSDLNNNPTTVPYVVGHAEKGAAETDILPVKASF